MIEQSARADLHRCPPCTPRSVLACRRWPVGAIAIAFAALALAALTGAPTLIAVDRAVHDAALDVRSAALTGFFQVATELGGGIVTAVAAMVAATVVWRRCPALALLVLFTTVSRPLLTIVLKAMVDRPRPDLDPLDAASGASFPSGHALAAIAFWGLVPPVVGVLTSSRRAWWASVALSAAVVATVGASRVYLGVHWLTDVVGSILVGMLLLVAVELLLERLHQPPATIGSTTTVCSPSRHGARMLS